MYTTTSGLGSEGIERFFVTAIPPQQRTYVRHDEFAHKVRNIHKVFSLIRNGMSELWRRLPACRSVGSRDRFIPSLHTTYVCMYVVAVDNESKLFYCMMTLTAWWIKCCCCNCMLQNFREYIFFLFSLRLLLACFVKFFKAELCDKYLVGAVSYTVRGLYISYPIFSLQFIL